MTYATPKQEAAAMAGLYREEDTLRAARAMLAALKRIDGINDNPAHFSIEINEVAVTAIAQAEAAGIK